MKLSGRTAIVTGAANPRGIGRAVARAFAKEGANLVLVDIDEAGLKDAAEDIGALNVKVMQRAADVRDAVLVNRIVDEAADTFGGIDIVVNNAGGSARLIGQVTPFAQSQQSTWEWVLGLNLLAPMIMNRAVVPYMIKKKYGKIINLGSVAGVNGIPNMVDYSAAKGGVIAMTHALAKELGGCGINVNCVSPGAIESRDNAGPTSFLGRRGQPWEVAALILFLSSPDSDYITGQNYLIDGGRCLSTNV